MMFFVLLEVILAYFYERSFNVRRTGTLPTTVVVGPGPIQQYSNHPAQPLQQYPVNVQQQPRATPTPLSTLP